MRNLNIKKKVFTQDTDRKLYETKTLTINPNVKLKRYKIQKLTRLIPGGLVSVNPGEVITSV